MSSLHVGTNIRLHEEAEPDAFQHGGAREARFVQGDRPVDIDLRCPPAFLALPPIKGAIGQPDTDARVIEEVGRDTRPLMLLEICRRADDGISLWAPQRHGDRVAGHEVGHPHTEVKSFSDDVDQSSLGDEIDMNLRIAVANFNASGGSVINISSLSALGNTPGSAVYSASKAAVNAITKVLALELAARKIRVNAIMPGYFDTEGARAIGVKGSEKEARLLAATPLKKAPRPPVRLESGRDFPRVPRVSVDDRGNPHGFSGTTLNGSRRPCPDREWRKLRSQRSRAA